MPYSSTSELPKPVRDKYSDKCQRAFMHAFNSTHDSTGDEGKASAAGHAAAQRCEGKKSMDDIVTAEAKPVRQFQIFTGILKAGGSPEEGMTLHGVASSTVRDLHGDQMLESAIRSMERQAKEGLTIFLNHSYQVPEDVAGSTFDAHAIQRGADQDGNPVWDLDLDININDENPRAVEAWKSIRKKGTKLGLSIGANIPEDGVQRNDEGRYDFSDVNLLETSIVGIPANPRSWISKAMDAVNTMENQTFEPFTETWADDSTTTIIFDNGTRFNFSDLGVLRSEELDEAPPADDREEPETEEVEEDVVETAAEPEVPDGEDEIDETPEAESDPVEVVPLEGEDALVSAAIESLNQVDGEVTLTHLQMAVDIARALYAQNDELRRQSDEALRAKDDAERERDETIKRTGEILAGTHEIVEELGNMPLGRKTVVKEAKRKLSHLDGIYGSEFMEWLEK